MKNYIKPELKIDNIFANVTVATDAENAGTVRTLGPALTERKRHDLVPFFSSDGE